MNPTRPADGNPLPRTGRAGGDTPKVGRLIPRDAVLLAQQRPRGLRGKIPPQLHKAGVPAVPMRAPPRHGIAAIHRAAKRRANRKSVKRPGKHIVTIRPPPKLRTHRHNHRRTLHEVANPHRQGHLCNQTTRTNHHARTQLVNRNRALWLHNQQTRPIRRNLTRSQRAKVPSKDLAPSRSIVPHLNRSQSVAPPEMSVPWLTSCGAAAAWVSVAGVRRRSRCLGLGGGRCCS